MARLLPILLLATLLAANAQRIDTKQSLAKKGRFFVHQLHSASLFPHTVPVKWSATLKSRPELPIWLKLIPSRHSALAYLAGTPVTPLRQITVHVIAKRLDSAEVRQQFINIALTENVMFSNSTQQLVQMKLTNVEAESLLNDRSGLVARLEGSIKETFRGRGVNPYIFSIEPELYVPVEKMHLFRNKRIGTILQVGTQRGFYSNINHLVQSVRASPHLCRKPEMIPLNKYFTPTFQVDWCSMQMKNTTLVRDMAQLELEQQFHTQPVLNVYSENDARPPQQLAPSAGFSFWESVLVFPLIAVLCICLVLCLSAIFFGKREGQQWRDYKTPKEQLEEFQCVRDSQRHLRELSVQRQLLLMANDDSAAPSGIHSFLQPKTRASSTIPSRSRYSKSQSRLDNDESMELMASTDFGPVGKQTVAEAAKQCGSSLHLYRNPLDSESEEDEDSIEPPRKASY